MSSASEVNQTYGHQDETIGKPNEEVLSEEQANLGTPRDIHDGQKDEEEKAVDDVVEIER